MKTKTCMAVLIALVATGEAAAQNYCELEKIRYRSEGDTVTADFSSLDRSECVLGVETTVHVEGSVGDIHIADLCGSGPTSDSEVTDEVTNIVAVVVSVYDRCLAMSVRSITGTGAAEEIHVNPNRKTGSLRAAISGTDELDQPVSIAIDLVWNGVGHKDRTNDRVNTNQGIYKLVYASSGTIRDAAAAGSVTIDGADITPLPATRGTIEKNVTRSFEVYR
jgi:hypothetical protein